MAVNYIDGTNLQYTLNLLKNKLATIYVAQDPNKGLSTNDLTDSLLQKINNSSIVSYNASVATGTEIGSITIDGTTTKIYVPQGQSITIDSTMSSTSENPVQNKVIKQYVDDSVAAVTGIAFEVVTSLPATGQTGTIYLVAKSSGSGQNIYTEYIWMASTSTYEQIGDTAVDLTNYLQKSDLVALTNGEIDTIFNAVFPTT